MSSTIRAWCSQCGHYDGGHTPSCPTLASLQQQTQNNKMPPGHGKRNEKRKRLDLIPLLWKEMLADIFEEGLSKYGDSWMNGGIDFLIDCLNHAETHLGRFNDGDYSEPQLEKVAWNCLAVAYHIHHNPELLRQIYNRKKIQDVSLPEKTQGGIATGMQEMPKNYK